MKKIHSQNTGTGREWKKGIPDFREREGNEEKNIPKNREKESEAIILGNGREREWTEKMQWLELIENVVKYLEK